MTHVCATVTLTELQICNIHEILLRMESISYNDPHSERRDTARGHEASWAVGYCENISSKGGRRWGFGVSQLFLFHIHIMIPWIYRLSTGINISCVSHAQAASSLSSQESGFSSGILQELAVRLSPQRLSKLLSRTAAVTTRFCEGSTQTVVKCARFDNGWGALNVALPPVLSHIVSFLSVFKLPTVQWKDKLQSHPVCMLQLVSELANHQANTEEMKKKKKKSRLHYVFEFFLPLPSTRSHVDT